MHESGRVTGPVEGQPGIIMAGFDLRQVGYTLEEFFLEGTATSFEPVGEFGADGRWQVRPSGRTPFVTRLVVCRPSDPGAFTGTVVLEWLNVSAGFDAPAHWMLTHRQVVRAGWAWVGVSAQRAGIEGGNVFDTAGAQPDQTLRSLAYPGGQAEYAHAFRAATSRAVADGFVLAEDADEMVAVAAAGYPVRVP
jgi:hypothetical protein